MYFDSSTQKDTPGVAAAAEGVDGAAADANEQARAQAETQRFEMRTASKRPSTTAGSTSMASST